MYNYMFLFIQSPEQIRTHKKVIGNQTICAPFADKNTHFANGWEAFSKKELEQLQIDGSIPTYKKPWCGATWSGLQKGGRFMCLPGFDGNGDGREQRAALKKLPLKLRAFVEALQFIYPNWTISLGFLHTDPQTGDQGPHFDVEDVFFAKLNKQDDKLAALAACYIFMPLEKGTEFGLFHDNENTNSMWRTFEEEVLAAESTLHNHPFCNQLRKKHVNKIVMQTNDFYVQGGGTPHFGGSNTTDNSNIRVVISLYNEGFPSSNQNQYWLLPGKRNAVIPE